MEQTMKVANNLPFPNQEYETWNIIVPLSASIPGAVPDPV
jgi:hypothetical protein